MPARPDPPASPTRGLEAVRAVWWRQLLVLLGLTGFAISQPMLSLLGDNPTAFTFYGVEGLSLVAFALIVALVPPLVLWALGLAVTAIDARAGRIVHLALVAVLTGLTVIQIVKALDVETEVIVVAAAVAGAVALTWAYARFAAARTWLQFTAVLPALALFLFLFASPTSDLLGGPRSVAVDDDQQNDLPPVVMIVLDELPTKSLLDADDEVDAVRFPNLAAFGEDATWYRNYTTVAGSTQQAVPAILSGSMPDQRKPIASNYPDTLFSLLAPTHDLVAYETATKLCDLDSCTEGKPGTTDSGDTQLASLLDVTADLYRERISPRPGQGAQLDTFEEEVEVDADATTDAPPPTLGGAPQGDPFGTESVVARPKRFDNFIDTLEPRENRPALFFLHIMLPHSPWRYTADGEPYDAAALTDPGYPYSVSNDLGAWVSSLAEQRHLLQAQYADALVGEVIDELKARDLYDEALVVVVADHGISFEPGTSHRALHADSLEGLDGLGYSPLFVKPPGQTEGTIDDDPLMAIDVLPTMAAALGVEIPFDVEGVAADDPARAERGDERRFLDLESQGIGAEPTIRRTLTFEGETYFPSMADRWVGPIDDTDDPMAALYRAYELDDLIGRPLADLSPSGSLDATIPHLADASRPADGKPPRALLSGSVDDPDASGTVVAAVDGTIVAASPLFEFYAQPASFAMLLPVDRLHNEPDIEFALVDGDRATALRITG
jgi:hypothetical protein